MHTFFALLLLLPFFAFPTLNDITETFGVAVLIAAAAIGACLGTVRGIKKWRAAQVKLQAAEELLVQGRIEKEVDALKAQHDLALALHKGQLEMLERVADGEKRLAEQAISENESRRARLEECTKTIRERDERIKELNMKMDEIVDLNLNLQGALTTMRQSIEKNKDNIELLRQAAIKTPAEGSHK